MDYSSVDWESIIEYSEESPSGLVWKEAGLSNRSRSKTRNYKYAGCASYCDSLKTVPKCWLIGYKGKIYKAHRIVWKLISGTLDEELVIDHKDGNPLNNCISNLRLVPNKLNRTNMKIASTNKTGVTGVTRCVNKSNNNYYVARCQTTNPNGKVAVKYSHFSIDKLGEAEAFRLACEYRAKMIEELNANGAGYTTRHGT